jgi:transposase
MLIIGCDFHTRFQQIAMLDPATGELLERRLEHQTGEAKGFYASLPGPARVGMEATGYSRWFERILAEYGHEIWIGDAAQIRAAMVRKQKTDQRDAVHILELLLTNKFPRIWLPSLGERDTRQLLRHRHKLVGISTSLKNQLHSLAMGEGTCRGTRLWTKAGREVLTGLPLDQWASRRRQELLQFLDQLTATIRELDDAVEKEARQNRDAARLMTHPGVGPLTALAFLLTIGPVGRFQRSKQVVSYLGLNPKEKSSGGKQRLGSISKQGNSMARLLLVEAAGIAVRFDPSLRRNYQRLKFRRGSALARVAIARKLAVRFYWMLRKGVDYAQLVAMQGSSANVLVG